LQWLSFFIGKEWLSLFFLLFIAAHAIGQGQLFGFYIRNFSKSPKSIRAVFWEHNTLGSSSYNSIIIRIVFYSRTWHSISVFAVMMVFQLYLLLSDARNKGIFGRIE
jgi:hypothetical protein